MKNIKKLLIAFVLMIVTITYSFAQSDGRRAEHFFIGDNVLSVLCYSGTSYKDLARAKINKEDIINHPTLECSFPNQAEFLENILKNNNTNILKTEDNLHNNQYASNMIKLINSAGMCVTMGDVVAMLMTSDKPLKNGSYVKLLMVIYVESVTDGIMIGEPYDYICQFASRVYYCDRP